MIARRDRSEAEIRSALSAFEASEVDSVVEHLIRRGFLDDERLARRLVEANQGRSAAGPEKLKAALLKRGLPGEIASQAAGTTAVSAADLLRTNLNRFAGNRAKAGRFLATRGFEEDAIESALESVFCSDN